MSRACRLLAVLAVLASLACLAPPSAACIICYGTKSNPMHVEFALAPIVVFGHISKSAPSPDGVRGKSEFALEATLKDAQGAIKGKSAVTIHKLIAANSKIKFLVLADIIGG